MNEQNDHKLGITDHPIKILNLGTIIMIVMIVAGFFVMKASMVMGIVLMSIGICCFVVALTVFWRCPACDVELPFTAYKTRKCPFCGSKLD